MTHFFINALESTSGKNFRASLVLETKEEAEEALAHLEAIAEGRYTYSIYAFTV